VSPITENSSRPPPPTLPATTRPELRPIPIASWSLNISSIAAAIARAAASAWSAWSSLPNALHGLGYRTRGGSQQNPSAEQTNDDQEEDRPNQFVAARVAAAEERHADGNERDPRSQRP
jgi:hypothetical protein